MPDIPILIWLAAAYKLEVLVPVLTPDKLREISVFSTDQATRQRLEYIIQLKTQIAADQAKTTSAGQQLLEQLASLEDAFIDKLNSPEKAATLIEEVLKQYKAGLTDILTEVSKLAAKAGINRPLQDEIESKIKIQYKLIELAEILGQTIKQAVVGDIILDTAIIRDKKERELVESIFSNETVKGALEEVLSKKTKEAAKTTARVLLLKDLAKHESALSADRPIILISNDRKKLKLFKNAKLLKPEKEVSALAIPYHLGVAAALLSLDKQDKKASLILKLNRLSIEMTGEPLSEAVRAQLQDGSWEVFDFIISNLPGVEEADLAETERRVRTAVAAIIAA